MTDKEIEEIVEINKLQNILRSAWGIPLKDPADAVDEAMAKEEDPDYIKDDEKP